LCLLAVIVSAAGAGTRSSAIATQTPTPPTGGAPQEINGCSGVPKTPPGARLSTRDEQAWLCGTSVSDWFRGKGGGHKVRLYQGVDYVDLANGRFDEVLDFGKLDPKSKFDTCDTVNGRPARGTTACQGVRSSTRSRIGQTPPNYPKHGGALECRFEPDGRRIVHFLRDPLMRAVDVTPAIDSQTVAWSPVLNKWDAAQNKWVFVQENIWLWDRAPDEQQTEFPGNAWRRFDTQRRWFVWFHPPEPGIFRVAIRYHWYAAAGAPAFDVFDWAGPHYGPFEDYPGQSSCNFTR